MNYSTPGVYIEEVNALSLTIPSGATSIPVFIGVFMDQQGRRLANTECIRIESWLDFTTRFGHSAPAQLVLSAVAPPPPPPPPETTLSTKKKADKKTELVEDAPVVPTNKYDVRISHTAHLGSLSVRHYFDNGGGPCYILSIIERTTEEMMAMSDKIAKCPEISLLCLCEVTDNDDAMYGALTSLLSSNCGYFLIADSVDGASRPSTPAEQTAVYYPGLTTSYRSRPLDQYIFVEGYIEPIAPTESEPTPVKTLADIEKKEKAVYMQISEEVDKWFTTSYPLVRLRASPAVAGAYCRTDKERGVWKAPANVALRNVNALTATNALTVSVTDAQQAEMMAAGVNAIRYFSDRGAMIWGARTMVPPATPTWLYIPVRRLFNAAQRDIQQAMRFAVFQPNSQPTWEAVRSAINNYLYRLWRDGALMGESQEEAYFIQIGKDVTMTDTDIQQGRMIVKIGMAAVRPAEFIILEFTQDVEPA